MESNLQQRPSAPTDEVSEGYLLVCYSILVELDAATPLWKRRYTGTMMQIIILGSVCFLLPGMFNAINGLGAIGKADATITDNANTALVVTFAVRSLLGGILKKEFSVHASTLRIPSMTTTNTNQIVIHSSKEILDNDKSASKVVDNIESDEIPTCRICMESQLEDLDPIMPLGCGCRHGLGQAHQNCLIEWFCRRKFLSTLDFDGIPGSKNCEICKKKLSPTVRELLNVHWWPFLEQEMEENSILQRSEVMAPWQALREDGLTCKMLGCIIFMTSFVGFCIGYLL